MIIEKQKRRNISNLKVDLGEPKRPGTSGKSGYQEFKPAKCMVTIDCLDYSEQLDLIAFGGIQGKVGVLDSTTLSFKGMHHAHLCEITSLYFYDD